VSENSYDRLPEAMREHARAYVERHQPVGGFLTAVLSNDLVNAIGRADAENVLYMAEWAMWLWNDIPAPCWGSPEKVRAWLRHEDPPQDDEPHIWEVTFSAAFHVRVEADTEAEAEAMATTVAIRANEQFAAVSGIADDDTVIHTDDIVRIERQEGEAS